MPRLRRTALACDTYDAASLNWRAFLFAACLATATSAASVFFVELSVWAYTFVLLPGLGFAATTAIGVMMDRRSPVEPQELLARWHAAIRPYVSLIGFVIFAATAAATKDYATWMSVAVVVASIHMGLYLATTIVLRQRANAER